MGVAGIKARCLKQMLSPPLTRRSLHTGLQRAHLSSAQLLAPSLRAVRPVARVSFNTTEQARRLWNIRGQQTRTGQQIIYQTGHRFVR